VGGNTVPFSNSSRSLTLKLKIKESYQGFPGAK
jgi:hypothetical protein